MVNSKSLVLFVSYKKGTSAPDVKFRKPQDVEPTAATDAELDI